MDIMLFIFFIANIVAGVLLPYLLQQLFKIDWLSQKDAKTILAAMFSFAVGFAVVIATGNFDLTSLVASFGLVYVSSQQYFKLRLKPRLKRLGLL